MNSHYYNIQLKITIGKRLVIKQVKSIEIEKGIEKLSDTAKIELPREFRNLKLNGASASIAHKNIYELIKQDDEIVIEAGYNGDLFREFKGYITTVGADIPLVLECEDEMYKVKKLPKMNKTFGSCNLKEVLHYILPAYEIDAIDMPMGKFMIDHAAPFEILEKLKKDFLLRFYFKDKKFIATLPIDLKPQQTHPYVFGKNIRKSSDLKFKTKEARKVFIKAVSHQKGKKKIFFEYGDRTGDQMTLHAPLNLTKKELEEFTIKNYQTRNQNGYEGTVDGWAVPRVTHGDCVDLIDPNYPDRHRDGRFLVESVKILINESDGIKRQSKLSYKLSK